MPNQSGHWAKDRRGHKYWNGPRFWTTVIDGTTVEYVTDCPVAAYGCVTGEGARVTAICVPQSEGEETQWLVPRPDGSFRGGRLEPFAGGLRFVEAPVHGVLASMYWQGGERGRSIALERGASRWQGPLIEAELHGLAVIEIQKNLGRTLVIRGCRFSDGSRGSILRGLPEHEITDQKIIEHEGCWRRPLPDGSWREGSIEIAAVDIAFTDHPAPPRRLLGAASPDDAPNLEADLMSSPRIAELVKDIRFATDLYRAFCNTDWIRNGQKWSTTWRSAGGIVADLRDLNEQYIDFYCSGDEGNVANDVAAELKQLGWIEAPSEEP